MLQINLSFRRLLMKYTPLLNERILKDIDSAIAFRQQLLEEDRLLQPNVARTAEINNLGHIIASKSKNFSAQIGYLVRLYSARRFFALRQGHLQQIPQSAGAFWQFILAAGSLLWVEVTTMPLIWWESIRMSLADLWEYIVAGLMVIIPVSLLFINNPPEITSVAITGGKVSDAYSDTVTAFDPDGDPITFKLIQKPAFLSINSTTGELTGTPTLSDTFAVKVVAEDSKGRWDERAYILFVSP